MIDTLKLKQICDEQGIASSSELAVRSGIHRNTVSGIFLGKVSPFSNSFLKIAETLEINPKELIINEDNNSFETQAKQIILKNLKQDQDIAFFIFGSRASRKARKYSDIDIGISGGPERISAERFLNMKEKFSEIFEDFPIKVDLSNFDDAPDWFLSELKQIPIFLCGDLNDFYFIQGFLDAKKRG